MNRFICYVISLLLLVTAAAAQVITLQGPIGERRQLPETFLLQEGNVGWARTADGAATVFTLNLAAGMEPVKNAPYTATAITESTQTLHDGNRIVHKNSAFLARDGQGRTRREETLSQLGTVHIDGPEQKMVVINDPTTHTEYILNPSEQVARVVKPLDTQRTAVLRKKLEGTENGEPSEGLRKKLEGMQSAEPGAVTVTKRRVRSGEPAEYKGETGWSADKKHEDLGVQQIEGVSCQGKRDTITIPAGAEGNERPMQIVNETCYSEDLHAFVSRKSSDPRFGDTEYRLTNIKLGEPDASLFQVPANYKSTT